MLRHVVDCGTSHSYRSTNVRLHKVDHRSVTGAHSPGHGAQQPSRTARCWHHGPHPCHTLTSLVLILTSKMSISGTERAVLGLKPKGGCSLHALNSRPC